MNICLAILGSSNIVLILPGGSLSKHDADEIENVILKVIMLEKCVLTGCPGINLEPALGM